MNTVTRNFWGSVELAAAEDGAGPAALPVSPLTSPGARAATLSPRSIHLSPPPLNETCEERKVRQQRELLVALKQLHDTVVKWDESDSMIFIHPVDASIAPDYYLVVKEPMDLTTIGDNIRSGKYITAWHYLRHVHLMIDNALLFNKPGTFHNKYAQRLQKFWVTRAEEMMVTTLASHNYCCGRRRRLSGHSYRCRGATCFVKYGCVYWYYDPQDGEDAVVYCQAHYAKLRDPEVVIPRFGNGTGGEIRFHKSQLIRTKHNTPLVEEKIVTCAECGQEDHEICKQHLSFLGKPYHCDRCREQLNIPDPPIQSPRNLPHCPLSEYLEKEVSGKVPLVGQRVCIRVVNAESVNSELKPLMMERYPEHPKFFPYVQKVIVCFMDIEGRPIVFFGMIVHECGPETPQPNRERVYISLLDSIKLPKTMLPSMYRTAIYHAVVRGYLRYVGGRGFKYAHLYTCPPRKGQNYILPFKPDDQKEISTARLRKWYSDLLTQAANTNPPALSSFRNIGEVFKNAKLTEIPYFDGDNWPDIMEDILKFDNAQKDEESTHLSIKAGVETNQLTIWKEAEEKRPAHAKPKCQLATQSYVGLQPRPRKRRKSEAASRPPKPKYSLQERLNLVIAQLKRDFLVVELCHGNKDVEATDADLACNLAITGGEHTIQTYLRSEKLEFSSLRHAKFSTMCLLYALFLEGDALPPERWPSTTGMPT